MEINFKLYEEGQRLRSQDVIHVTLNKEFRILFNKWALAAIGDPDAVALMYDERLQVIGVMPCALNRKFAYRLRKKRNMGKARLITAKNFCQHFGIAPSKTIAFPDASVNKNGVLVLDMHKARDASR